MSTIMSKAVMISIQPKWCELIASGKKTVEIRKTKPKLETPFKCYIYCTKSTDMLWILNKKERAQFAPKIADIFKAKDAGGATNVNGKIIGEFVCDKVESIDVPYPAYSDKLDKRIIEQSQVPYYALHKYAYHDTIYGWHISDLVIYDKPKELSEFIKPCIYGDDGEGDYSCYMCEKSGFTPDLHIDCFNTLTRPPQSWCYVEQLRE